MVWFVNGDMAVGNCIASPLPFLLAQVLARDYLAGRLLDLQVEQLQLLFIAFVFVSCTFLVGLTIY